MSNNISDEKVIKMLKESVFTYALYPRLLEKYKYNTHDFVNRPVNVISDIMSKELSNVPFKFYCGYSDDISIISMQFLEQYYEGASPILVEFNIDINSKHDLNRIKISNQSFYDEHISWRINSMSKHELTDN
jgi:hypothetical protein